MCAGLVELRGILFAGASAVRQVVEARSLNLPVASPSTSTRHDLVYCPSSNLKLNSRCLFRVFWLILTEHEQPSRLLRVLPQQAALGEPAGCQHTAYAILICRLIPCQQQTPSSLQQLRIGVCCAPLSSVGHLLQSFVACATR